MAGREPVAVKRVLITGAAGAIGRALRSGLRGRYPALRLSDLAPLGDPGPGEELCTADIRDLAATEATMEGVDCVVHLAAVAVEDAWERVLDLNIIGTYAVFEAARRRGVRRIVFASSNHAVGYYRREEVLDPGVLPRPDSRYGVSKVFGEALGRLYADKYGLSVACLRIGSFRDRPENARQLGTWISPRDTVQLVRRCIEAPDYHFLVVYGVSANTRSRWSNAGAECLGYRPEDDAEAYAEEVLRGGEPEDEIAARFHGGPFCALEFTGDLAKIR